MTKLLLGKETDAYVKCSKKIPPKQGKIYSIALGKCTEAMKNILKGEETYEDIDGEYDVICLLLIIKSIA